MIVFTIMSQTHPPASQAVATLARESAAPDQPPYAVRHARPMRLVPVMLTLGAMLLAAVAAWATWDIYMVPPWTRDATVRAYVVTIAPEVAGPSSLCPWLTTNMCTRAIRC